MIARWPLPFAEECLRAANSGGPDEFTHQLAPKAEQTQEAAPLATTTRTHKHGVFWHLAQARHAFLFTDKGKP
ncbi:hypothetical protein GCM10010174_73900 [Kutzneria viridogrisea]